MPLQLEAAPPEPYIWGNWERGDLGPFSYIFARGHMALCAVSGQFVVPLDPPSTAGPGPRSRLSAKKALLDVYPLKKIILIF